MLLGGCGERENRAGTVVDGNVLLRRPDTINKHGHPRQPQATASQIVRLTRGRQVHPEQPRGGSARTRKKGHRQSKTRRTSKA